MDAVRFGRALGLGARGAAKAAMMAAEAAAAPRPAGPQSAGPQSQGTASEVRVGETAARTAARTSAQARVTTATAGLAQGTRRFGEATWGPFVRLSGVLWLELTGVFFGLFLLTAGASVWKLRANLHDTATNHVAHQRLLWSIAMAVVFGYFCLSSFIRAARRERRRG